MGNVAPSSRSPSVVGPGDLVAGKYRVERVIAAGGMGVVVAARHESLDQRYAIKLLRPEILDNEEAVARFLTEARTAARLESEHVARVFDVGRLDAGVPYMVMEYLDGVDLDQLVESRGPLPVVEAVDLVVQALQAIAEAHAAGIVHRDIKPANLVLTKRSDGSARIKVLDFGISKHRSIDASGAVAGAITSTQQVIGSPQYMAPEQISSPKNVDGRADVWAIGATLHDLLTGKPPFDGETVGLILARVLRDSPPRLRSDRPDAPAGLEKVLLRCMEREPSARFRNVAELSAALAPFGSTASKVAAERIAGALGRGTSATLSTSATSVRYGHPAPGRVARLVGAGLFGAALLGAGAWALLGGRNVKTEPAVAPAAEVAPPRPPTDVGVAPVAASTDLAPASASAAPLAPASAQASAAPAVIPRFPATSKGGTPNTTKKTNKADLLNDRQ
ncbi:serine/threonine-protein kinase [Polyangium sp. 6x1]|uniref:serine/threonine-protein kinase n=1 Tax=Polyangium sp. 6x1 TaxID=3042689 RepID=UPI0024831764|nr:serine/threonine-protein kinase [Polyangium sp. 6x1]MDI1450349.1 serine/threonine-protein kinase [Polyangium sp. 6x1]